LKLEPKEITVTSTDEKFLVKVMEVVESRMADVTFSVEQLSEAVGMSRKNLHRKMVALLDQAPNEFIRIFRLKAAMQLLEKQGGSVKEVAFAVGFNNLSYFAKCFKEQFGLSPTEVTIRKTLSPEDS
jgi:transcriptional regulator GlxA family with amidase domain